MNDYKLYDRIIMMVLSPLSCRAASKYIYWRAFHKKLNLKKPNTFNEKLMWLKLNVYTNNTLVTQCIDKYAVRQYVQQQGCGELLVPLLGVWECPEDIPFANLPESFVLKCNHGCGYNIICPDKNKLDENKARALLKKWLKENFWLRFAESNYKQIPKKIICETYIGGDDQSAPIDYKFYCFHGKAAYVMVCRERENGVPKFYFFNRNWTLERINPDGIAAPEGFTLPRPKTLDEMFAYADKLSEPFPFVRVDLYSLGMQIRFGELTFTPSAALDTARLSQADRMFCELLKLPGIEE